MLWGIGIVVLVIILIFLLAVIYFNHQKENGNTKNNIIQKKKKNETKYVLEPFISINDSNLYMPVKDKNSLKPENIKYQIPIAQNQLTDLQLQGLDSNILRNIRVLKNFSNTDELDFYQMYNLLKQFKNKSIEFSYDASRIEKKSHILESEKLIELNTGAINTTDLELFYRLKIEIISLLNNLVIRNGYYLPYHQYQFFKIINSNLISQTTIPAPETTTDMNVDNYVFTITAGREFKYEQFVIFFDIDLIKNANANNSDTSNSDTSSDSVKYTARINKVELIGLPIPNTIEFHENKKTSDKPNSASAIIDSSGNFLTNTQLQQNDLLTLIKNKQNDNKNTDEMLDIYKDQVSDSATFDVMPSGDGKMFQSPYTKFIDVTERSDMDPTLFNASSQSSYVEQRIMNVARDQQFKNHRCYGLVNGVSQELVAYNDNPIFCKSYHPEVAQVGIWDAPCQINTDCPFYKANKNYPNEFGKCNKDTGKCEMPMGVVPIGFTKYGRIEPDCYNCGMDSNSNKCCGKQANDITMRKVVYKSPDYIFKGDEQARFKFGNDLEEVGLQVNPSI
jgi:hypothetical protein